MNKPTNRPRISRDRMATVKTREFLVVERKGRPTTTAQIAKKFKISGGAASQRISTLIEEGGAERLSRGKVRGVGEVVATAAQVHTVAGGLETIDAALADLRQQRNALDEKIRALDTARSVIRGDK